MDEVIRELRDKTSRTRYQFLKAELQTCFTALEMAEFQLSVGNIALVDWEVATVENGIRTIHRFLPETSADQREELEARSAKLQATLDRIKAEVAAAKAP